MNYPFLFSDRYQNEEHTVGYVFLVPTSWTHKIYNQGGYRCVVINPLIPLQNGWNFADYFYNGIYAEGRNDYIQPQFAPDSAIVSKKVLIYVSHYLNQW